MIRRGVPGAALEHRRRQLDGHTVDRRWLVGRPAARAMTCVVREGQWRVEFGVGVVGGEGLKS